MKKEQADKMVMELLTKVRKKKEALKEAKKRPQWCTNCSVQNNQLKYTNIQTITDEAWLIELLALMEIKAAAYKKAADLLDLSGHSSYEYNGYSIEDWRKDFKTRATMIKAAKQKDEIEELDRRINKLVSPDQRREMELIELQELLDSK